MTISKIVEGLPIALAYIAGLMFSSRLILDETVEMLHKQNLSYLWSSEQGPSTHAYENRLGKVWDLALALKPVSSPSRYSRDPRNLT